MENWLSSGGRTAILSRDLSWANANTTTDILSRKAADGELTLFVSSINEQCERLADSGATVIEYGELDFTPRSRFTIIDFGKTGARVAIGSKEKGRHKISEYQEGMHPSFALAEDCIKLLLALKNPKNHI